MILAEILTTGGILALLGLVLKWLHGRVVAMEKTHATALYRQDHQPIYATKEDCGRVQQGFLRNIEEIKALIIKMDAKREDAKDRFTVGQSKIESRLTAIETKLEQYNSR